MQGHALLITIPKALPGITELLSRPRSLPQDIYKDPRTFSIREPQGTKHRNIISRSNKTCPLTTSTQPPSLFTMSSPTDKSLITTLLQAYATALNASSTPQVLGLYAPDGVFMAQHFPTAVGLSSVEEAYNKTFAAIKLTVEFEVIEIEIVGEGWAFARTASQGSVKMVVGQGGSSEANQELFVLKKLGAEWKIARYCFCTTLPPH